MVVLLGFLITKQVKIVMYFRNIIIFHEKRNYVFKNRNYVFIKKYILFLQGCSSFLYLSYCQMFTKLLKTAENAPKSVSEYIDFQ